MDIKTNNYFTKRLKLRTIEMEDLDPIHFLHSLPETDEFNTLGIPVSREVTSSIVQDWCDELNKDKITKYTFTIELKSDGPFIGLIALNVGPDKYKSAEVWYKIIADHWGKGYATEALNSILAFGFEQLKLHRIEAGCAIQNIGSIRVLEKVGMTREGEKRLCLPLKSGWSNNYEYAILDHEFRIKQKN
jgi:RimJ/RimL family protein N-acetyltransferase